MTQTGIPNLEPILGNGIPNEDALLVLSMPGSDKTGLDLHMTVHTPRPTARAFPPELTARLLKHFRRFSFCNESPSASVCFRG